jgi:hypothetical protein
MTLASAPERPDGSQHRGSPSITAERPKTLLFCPCGREAAPDEWRVDRDGAHRRLVCPDCGETLTVR